MSRSTAIFRERSRQSDDRRANDSSESLRELSALEESHRRLKRDHASQAGSWPRSRPRRPNSLRSMRPRKPPWPRRIGGRGDRSRPRGNGSKNSNAVRTCSAAPAASRRPATDSRNRLPTRKRRNASRPARQVEAPIRRPARTSGGDVALVGESGPRHRSRPEGLPSLPQGISGGRRIGAPCREAGPRHAGAEARGRGTQGLLASPRLRRGRGRDVSGGRQRPRPAMSSPDQRPPLRRPEGPQAIEDMFGIAISEGPWSSGSREAAVGRSS